MMLFVERHRKIIPALDRPRPGDSGLGAINARDLPRRRDVYEDARAVLFQLKRFRMAVELDVADALPARGGDDAERAVAIADVDSARRGVVADVVGVSRKL